MFFVNIIRLITGYVLFRGTGGFPERFLNLCASNGITVWDAKVSNGLLQAKTTIKCYKKIRLCAKRSGMKIRIQSKHGLPFIMRPYKKRKGLLVGAALSVASLVLLNSTIWTISVSGNEKYTKAQIISIAESYGIHPGAFKRNIDVTVIRNDIKATVPGINWFSVNMDGSHISLDVAELKGDTEIYDRTTPCNIVSTVDGEVIKLDSYEGNAEIAPGSAVTKGDLLISGIIEKEDGSARFVHARGEAIVRTRKSVSSNIPLTINISEISSVHVRKLPIVFGLEIPLTPSKNADSTRAEKNMLTYEDKILPIGIKTEYNQSYTKTQKELTQTQAVLLAGYYAFVSETDIMQNAQTQEKQVTVLNADTSVSVDISYINHEKTGLEQYFEIEE